MVIGLYLCLCLCVAPVFGQTLNEQTLNESFEKARQIIHFPKTVTRPSLKIIPGQQFPFVIFDGSPRQNAAWELWLYMAARQDATRNYLLTMVEGTSTIQSRVADGVRLYTTDAMEDMAGYVAAHDIGKFAKGFINLPKLDRNAGFAVHLRMRIHSENHVSKNRSGCSLIVITDDLKGVELAFWEDEIWAQTDKPLFTHGEGVLFDTRPMTDYELIIIGDAYELYVKDKLILGGALKDYSQRGLVYGIHDYLFLGDATSRGSADIEVQFLSVTSSPLPK